MSYFERINSAGLKVTWGTVLIGWDGPGKFTRLITPEEVVSFAIQCISDHLTEDDEAVLEVAGLTTAEFGRIDTLLRRFAVPGKFDFDWELRKWRLILLEETLNSLPNDPVHGLLALTAFWEKFGYPTDSPHIVQGRDNRIEPKDYYTARQLLILVEAHRRWKDKEILLLTREEIGRQVNLV